MSRNVFYIFQPKEYMKCLGFRSLALKYVCPMHTCPSNVNIKVQTSLFKYPQCLYAKQGFGWDQNIYICLRLILSLGFCHCRSMHEIKKNVTSMSTHISQQAISLTVSERITTDNKYEGTQMHINEYICVYVFIYPPFHLSIRLIIT